MTRRMARGVDAVLAEVRDVVRKRSQEKVGVAT